MRCTQVVASKCPYCLARERTSDDHVFPEFLGGKTTIRSCKPCNDVLGHSTEGVVSNDLAPVMVLLKAKAKIPTPKFVVWKRAFVDGETGVEYDLDSELGARSSKPIIERDKTGKVVGAFFHDDRERQKFVAAGARKGKKVTITERPDRKIPMPDLNTNLPFGNELLRMAVKMAVAVADRFGEADILDATARAFLLQRIHTSFRAFMDVSIYDPLEELRPPLAHFVYVEGDRTARSSYAIVQLYGLLQIYILLSERDYSGGDIAFTGTLDVANRYVESFNRVKPLRLPRPTQRQDYVAGIEARRTKWSQQIRKISGDPTSELCLRSVRPKPFIQSSTTATRTVFLTPPIRTTDE